MTGKALSVVGETGLRCRQPGLSAIRPAIPVTRPPILDRVKAPGLQMIVEQRLECCCASFTDMRGIVDDNVKSRRSRGGCDGAEPRRVSLISLEHTAAAAGID